jgi:chorismate-pyruvate lyase
MLNRCENMTDHSDRAADWAAQHEFKLRRAWWRRVRFTPVVNGMLAMTEAFKDMARVMSGRPA